MVLVVLFLCTGSPGRAEIELPGENNPDFWWWLRSWSNHSFNCERPVYAPRAALAHDMGERLWPSPTLNHPTFDRPAYWPEDEAGLEQEDEVQQHSRTTQVFNARLTSQVTVNRDRRRWEEPPLPYQPWRTEENVQLPVLGPFYAFGQFGAAPDVNPSRELRVSSRGGLGCRMEPLPGAELQLRGGPVMTFRERAGGEEAQWLLEVQARYALPLSLGLEYQGSAMPALNPAARDRVTQDVRLAVSLSDFGQFRVGARHQWENAPDYRPWDAGMQLYLGFELKRNGPR